MELRLGWWQLQGQERYLLDVPQHLRLVRVGTLVAVPVERSRGCPVVFRENHTERVGSTYIQEILHSTIWVKESGSHRSINVRSWKSHALHVCDCSIPLGAQRER